MSKDCCSTSDRDTTSNASTGAENVGGREDRVKCAMRRLREMSDQTNAETGTITWTREDIHER
jgi:hypothetical protein